MFFKRKTHAIALMGVFTALGVVLNIFSSVLPKVELFGRVSFIYAFCYLCGFFFGPWFGSLVAMLSDFIPAVLLPEGGVVWMPLITLGNGSMALIAGFVFYRISWKSNIAKLAVIAVGGFLVGSLGFTAFGEALLYEHFGYGAFYPSVTALVNEGMTPYLAFIVRKCITQPVWVVLNAAIAYGVVLSSHVILRRFSGKKELSERA